MNTIPNSTSIPASKNEPLIVDCHGDGCRLSGRVDCRIWCEDCSGSLDEKILDQEIRDEIIVVNCRGDKCRMEGEYVEWAHCEACCGEFSGNDENVD